MIRPPKSWLYRVTVRSIGGPLRQLEVEAGSLFEAHQAIRYGYPDCVVVKIAPVGD